ncbi:uncharacterized protein [Bactrocera oleae]|nr:uncharacterized protein LOC106620704 isoform X1 [Bactrocera oleae]XP_036231776.1 uncharacterized protein LOC106620704 isoform X1 [Bactrocera oleae]XP_036231777.1 uncharacterized protein LOC106620704 isoform X1 [Bactrocera oleae]XP_036231778.1 uncharacterized protein LOC106620704 isoform X1 [Bactrocera oleae]XP_036231780.1 uncharacterized protein LOC106620704 isoform X1 [Bactrocera oleae]
MDSNRHHEVIDGNDERRSAMYFTRGIDDGRTNTEYYSHERVNNKSCVCPNMSNNITCNACPSTSDGTWNSEHSLRVDFQKSGSSRDKINQNLLYPHDGRQFFHSNGDVSYGTEVIPTNRSIVGLQHERNSVSNKSCALESNYNFEQQLQHQQSHHQLQPPNLIQMQTHTNTANITNLPPHQLQQNHHQHIRAISNYPKESIYDDIVGYHTSVPDQGSTKATIYSEVIPSQKSVATTMDLIHNSKMDPSNIVNPSNSLALKEQQGSPNYARKCPQIFVHSDHNNVHTSHQSLYMSTPQFSSDKFSNIHAQRKIVHESELKVHGYVTDMKMNELQMPSYNNYSQHVSGNNYHHSIHETTVQQSQLNPQHQEPLLTNVNPHLPRNHSYYMQGAKTQVSTTAEREPITTKQMQITSQYSKNQKALPSHSQLHSLSLPHQLAKTPAHDIVFKNKEVIFSDSMPHQTSGLYANPYKTSSPLDTCCKDVTSPYDSITNSFSENNVQHVYFKYGKIAKETITKTNFCTENQNTPPPTPVRRSSGYKDQPYFYEAQHTKHDNNAHITNYMSPSIAVAASPSPSHTTPPSHIQMQHTSLTPQSQSQSPSNYTQMYRRHHNQIETNRSSGRTHQESAAVHPSPNYCGYERHSQNSKPLSSHSVTVQTLSQAQSIDPQMQPKQISHLSNQGPKQNNIKKSQVPKTNYRELINQVVAMRSATSEKELDLQIIKKALNSASGQTGASPVDKLSQTGADINNGFLPLPINTSLSKDYGAGVIENGILAENAPTSTHNMTKVCKDSTLSELHKTIKIEEPLTPSPLDLSMRTVKTKADSTEYRYNQAILINPQADFKHTLPRVDFTPNFSLHADVTSRESKIIISQQNEQFYNSSEVTRPVIVPVDSKVIAAQPEIKKSSKQFPSEYSSKVCTITPRIGPSAISTLKETSMAINTSEKSLPICQMRPSVVETNPFATVKTIKSKTVPVIGSNVPATAEHFKLATNMGRVSQSIQSTSSEFTFSPAFSDGVIKAANSMSSVDINPLSNTIARDQRNRNYLGRKRHLQEYSNSQRTEPVVKQQRYQEHIGQPNAVLTPTISTSTAVIAINDRIVNEERGLDVKTVDKSIHAEIVPCCQKENTIIVNNNVPICKIEPLTPTMDTPPPTVPQPVPIVPIKTETNLIIAARIRTKAELKGFTFSTPINVPGTIKESIKIKEEPSICSTLNAELPSIPGLDEKYDLIDIIDCNWNSKCTDFMEQLLTSSRNIHAKCRFGSVNMDIRVENQKSSNDIKELETKDTTIGNNTSNVSIESAESSKSCDITDVKVESTMTGERFTGKSPEVHSSQSNNVIIQKKISKHDREKMRLLQEKRIAARLQVDSSSESDNEIIKRKSDRSKKPLKKVKTRQNNNTNTNQFSDCGCDSSESNDYNDCKNLTTKTSVQENDEKDIQANVSSKLHNLQEATTLSNLKDKCQINAIKNIHSVSDRSKSPDDAQKLVRKSIREKEIYNTNIKEQIEKNKAITSMQNNSKCKEDIEEKKGEKKPKVHLMVGLNTMTRSKQKREMELQLANSKVLRNDKIIRNSTTKIKSIKRKYVRKFANNQSSTLTVCKELSKKQCDRELSMRLRSRNEKSVKSGKTEKVPGSSFKKFNKAALAIDKSNIQNSKPKDKERQLLLEAYRYKRSLKIPPSLITIDHSHNLKMASSLPDLEREQDPLLSNTNRSSKFAKSIERLLQKSTPNISEKSTLTTKTQQEEQLCRERRSIIDVLHSRVINTSVAASTKLKNKKNVNHYGVSSQVHSDVSHSAESSSVTELFSIPVKKEHDEESSDGKKRHFSIFETTVLKTKTRTESKMQQRKEIIREIFVGDDRPASAPPEIISQMSDGNDKMTFEQKYEQFLQQLNIVINDSVTIGVSATTSTANQHIKDKEDTLASIGVPETHDNKSLNSKVANRSTLEIDNITSGFRRRRPGKYLRRKGSSGFDYIRKKKKSNSTLSGNQSSVQNLQMLAKVDRKTEEEKYEKKVKTESDVCREINKWVLNKSVGQSAMHKAARLGYIDVVVYCLDRMGMNPDQKDNAGYTPLHEACTKGWLEIARTLLQYGANHSEAAHSGIRPLHEASENDHEEIVRLLLSYGADPLLATYSGQTPLMLAASTAMRNLLNNHLSDVQNVEADKKPWRFRGPWEILDSSIYGYDIFGGAPNFTCDMSRALRKSSVSNSITNKKQINSFVEVGNNCKTKMENCAVVLDNIDRFNSVRLYNDNKPEILVENSDSEGEMFEFEEADILLPPLYLLKDEGTDKWVLLSDLCNLLKVKSKDTLLNKIYPPSSSASSAHKSLMRELKMSDFLERATCLQLLCAGEKINICSSKVVLIKYNDSVRNLLGVKTILMKF